MSRIAVLFLRIFVILAGYVLAVSAGVAFFLFLLILIPGAMHSGSLSMGSFRMLLGLMPNLILAAAFYSFLPALIVINVTEHLGKRDWLSHTLAGIVVSLLTIGFALLVIWLTEEPNASEMQTIIMPMFFNLRSILTAIGCGAVGGTVYWLVAGWRAGLWRKPIEPATSASSTGN